MIHLDTPIYSSTTIPPPSRKDDSNVRSLCSIKCNKGINVNELPKHTSPLGQAFSKFEFRIKMDCEDGTVGFAIYYKGSKVGEQNVEVQFS
jgi:hypothetical protein